jgi:hypothetical protein
MLSNYTTISDVHQLVQYCEFTGMFVWTVPERVNEPGITGICDCIVAGRLVVVEDADWRLKFATPRGWCPDTCKTSKDRRAKMISKIAIMVGVKERLLVVGLEVDGIASSLIDGHRWSFFFRLT